MDAGGDVSPDVYDFEVGAEELKLGGAADAAGGYGGLGGEAGEPAGVLADEGVFDGGAREDGGDGVALGELGGDVFEGVNGEVDGAVGEGEFEFFGEDAFVDDLVGAGGGFGEFAEFEVLAFVSDGGDDVSLGLESGCGEGGFCEGGLGEGEVGAAGA